MNKYDVIVIGGGPAGSIAARTLAASGAKVLLVEKNFRRVKPCGGATPSVSFEEFDLPQNEIAKKINTISTISPKGFRIDASITSGYIAMVERGELDNSLRRQAELSGADLAEAELINLRGQGVKGSRGQGVLTTIIENGKERTIASDFLIAADGVNSRTAKIMGLETLPGVYTIQEEVDINDAGNSCDFSACEFWFGTSHAPDFYSWVFPKKGYLDIGTGAADGKVLKGILRNFKLRRGISIKGEQKVYRLPLKQRKQLVYGNVLFVGDAAGLVMPLSYEGIYYALRSGKMAAEAIIAGRPGTYEKEWNKKFSRQFKLMGRLREYFLNSDKRMEKLIELHKRKEVQEASLRLWFEKDLSVSAFLSYMGFFRKFLFGALN